MYSSQLLRQLRKRWKRYTFGGVAFTLLAGYLTRKFRDNNVIRQYCLQAKDYGEGKVRSGPLEQQRKVTVFLNPTANKQEAKIQFTKYCAPIFHLAGVDVTVIESDYEGQIRTLMGYIDPNTDVIVVAGGDGTLMEVVNGLMRRYDAQRTHTIPIGILPLGKENRFYKSSSLCSHYHQSPARRLGEAAMDILSGVARPVNLMALQPENGKTIFALSSIQWGALNDAARNRDSFKLFGKLRMMVSHLSTAVRKWPLDHSIHVWMPSDGWETESTHGGQPPRTDVRDEQSARGASDCANNDSHVTKTSNPLLSGIRRASCVEQSGIGTVNKLTSLADNVQGHPQWSHRTFNIIGFSLSLTPTQSNASQPLLLSLWSDTIPKSSFIKLGWSSTIKASYELPSKAFRSSEMIIQPVGRSWLTVDGEEFEPMPLAIRVLPNHLQILTRSRTDK